LGHTTAPWLSTPSAHWSATSENHRAVLECLGCRYHRPASPIRSPPLGVSSIDLPRTGCFFDRSTAAHFFDSASYNAASLCVCASRAAAITGPGLIYFLPSAPTQRTDGSVRWLHRLGFSSPVFSSTRSVLDRLIGSRLICSGY
jgi:hypothetical protein